MLFTVLPLLLGCMLVLPDGSSGQQLVCPVEVLVNISSSDNNVLVFANFPPDSDSPDVSYDPGALGAWYDIASGIINTIQPGSVTEGIGSTKCHVIYLLWSYWYISSYHRCHCANYKGTKSD